MVKNHLIWPLFLGKTGIGGVPLDSQNQGLQKSSCAYLKEGNLWRQCCVSFPWSRRVVENFKKHNGIGIEAQLQSCSKVSPCIKESLPFSSPSTNIRLPQCETNVMFSQPTWPIHKVALANSLRWIHIQPTGGYAFVATSRAIFYTQHASANIYIYMYTICNNASYHVKFN